MKKVIKKSAAVVVLQSYIQLDVALATQDHQAFVDLVVADALGKSFSLAG